MSERTSISIYYQIMNIPGNVIEFGSGIDKIKEVIPDCICTDILPNPWIDRAESVMQQVLMFSITLNFRLIPIWNLKEYL